jgi:hypothetical protein
MGSIQRSYGFGCWASNCAVSSACSGSDLCRHRGAAMPKAGTHAETAKGGKFPNSYSSYPTESCRQTGIAVLVQKRYLQL